MLLNTVGVVGIPHDRLRTTEDYFDSVLHGIFDGADRYDCNVIVFRRNAWTGDLRTPSMSAPNCDGVIVLGTALTDDIYLELETFGIPAITIGGGKLWPDFSSVDVDNYAGARAAVDHLIKLGHTRIGAIHGATIAPWAAERRQAYTDALTDAGLDFDDTLLQNIDVPGRDDGYEAAFELLAATKNNPPTAIVTVNDDVAIGALTYLKQVGLKVPDDISLMGFDDIDAGRTASPGLSTIRQPMHAIGRRSVELLFGRVTSPASPVEHVDLPPELMVRGSTAPASVLAIGN